MRTSAKFLYSQNWFEINGDAGWVEPFDAFSGAGMTRPMVAALQVCGALFRGVSFDSECAVDPARGRG